MSLFIVPRRYFGTKRYQYSYNVLQAKRDSSPREIKESFLKLSKLYHPDNPQTGSHNKFLKVKQAFDQIKEAPLAQNSHRLSDDDDVDLSHKAFISRRRTEDVFESSFRYSHSTANLYKLSHASTSVASKLWSFIGLGKVQTKNEPVKSDECDKF